ncbi:MAG: tyrosine--tRNA ligase, partial [Chloroflexi bacterium]|nr:tyrosine--tRNA ligase [Chloroflexota bacterium]
RYGHTPIAIAGGGTGMIGDPRPTAERQLLSKEKVEENVEGIRVQLARFLDFTAQKNPAKLINNADWLLKLGLVDFLRDAGKQFTVNYMLGKESVTARLEREAGISFTEFSYMLLQAYDYLELYRQYGCRLQMGGSDQWGNILAGVDLIKRVEPTTNTAGIVTGYTRGEPHALVYPLLTTASGEKFGKSEGNAIWLDPSMTSPYWCFQYWMNADDRDVVTYLKWFTLLAQQEIAGLEEAVRNEPAKREAQQTLARAVTLSVHGQSGLDEAERVTAALFRGDLGRLAAGDIEDVLASAPTAEISRTELENGKLPFDRFAVAAGLCTSNAEARRLVEQGGAYLNDVRVRDARQPVTVDSLIEGRVIVLRRGAKTYRLVRVKS